jgi:hypothetical protein
MDLQTLGDVLFYLMVALCLAVAAYRDSRHGDRTGPGVRRAADSAPLRANLRQGSEDWGFEATGRATPGKDLRPGFPVGLVAVSIVFGAPLFLLLQNDSGAPASQGAFRVPSVAGEDTDLSTPGQGAHTAQNYCPANYADQRAKEDGREMLRENR